MKLSTKLTLIFLLFAVLPVLILGYLAYYNARQVLGATIESHLGQVSLLKESEFRQWIQNGEDSLELLAQRPLVRVYALSLANAGAEGATYANAYRALKSNHLQPALRPESGFKELFLMRGADGVILASTVAAEEGMPRGDRLYFRRGQLQTFVHDIYLSSADGSPNLTIATPVKGDDGRTVAVLAGRLDMATLARIMEQGREESETQETYLVNTAGQFVTRSRFIDASPLSIFASSTGVEACLAGNSGIGTYSDYRGVTVLGAYRWLPERALCLVTEIDEAEVLAPVQGLRLRVLGASLLAALVGVFVSFVVPTTFTRPVRRLLRGAAEFGRGNLEHRIQIEGENELGQLAGAFNAMAAELDRSLREQLRQQRFLNSLYEGVDLGIFVIDVGEDGEFRFAGLNPAHEALTGLRSDQLQGKTPAELVPDTLSTEAAQAVEANYARCLAQGEAISYEEMIPFQGRETWWLTRLTPLRSGEDRIYRIIGTSLEISERVRMERELQAHRQHLEELVAERTAQLAASEARFRYIAEATPVALTISRRDDGRLLFANEQADRMHGVDLMAQPDLLGRDVFNDPAERSLVLQHLPEEGGLYGYEVQLRRLADGQPFWASVNVQPIQFDGQAALFTSYIDITERKQAVQSLAQASDRFVLMLRVSAAANLAANFGQAAQQVISLVCQEAGWPVGHVYLLEEGPTPSLIPADIWYMEDAGRYASLRELTMRTTLPVADGPLSQAVRLRQPQWVSDLSRDPHFLRGKLSSDLGVRTVLAFPVLAGQEVVAVAEFFSNEEENADVEMLDLAAFIGTQVGRVYEREQAQVMLRRSEEQYRQLAETADDVILTHDLEGRITYINPAGRALLDLDGSLPTGRNIVEFVAPAYAEAMKARQQQRLQEVHDVFHYETAVIDGLGAAVPLEVSSTLLKNGGAAEGVLLIARDISERKEAERKLAAYSAELARSNADLEQFAYVASHDLQEPLRMVSSYTQLLARRYRGRLDEDADEFIAYAVDGANRMQRLIQDLLSYSRVNTRGQAPAPVEMGHLLQQVREDLQFMIEENGATISADEPLPIVEADAGQLRHVLQNLIGNAIKFHGDAPPRIHLSARRLEGEWQFALQDNGIGFEPEYGERIFVIFQRLHSKGKYPGTGIGLALCKRIIERHGGRIWAESQPGAGSTFYFTLPLPQTGKRHEHHDPTPTRLH